MARDSIRARLRRRLLALGHGARVTGAQLCDMYVAEGGADVDPARRDHGHGSTMYRLQRRMPIRRVSGEGGFSVRNVYEVDDARELELRRDDLLHSRPAVLWEKVGEDL